MAEPGATRTKIFDNSSVGELLLRTSSFAVDGTPETRMTVYTAEDEESAARLAALQANTPDWTGCPHEPGHHGERERLGVG